jgi:hypothetical protein
MIFFFIFMHSHAQVFETTTTEQQLENTAEHNEDQETEDDSYLQQMQHFLKNPVNLNLVSASELKEFRMLTPIQIQNFILYRALVGKLVDIYELQAVPGWDLQTIQKIRPFITVSLQVAVLSTLNTRFKNGEHSILIRVSQVLEKSKGYLPDSSTATNFYPGSPQKILFRYKYVYKNLLQFGIVGEKDAGEEFFKGTQKQGFDFYSVHLFARRIGIVQALAIGDFTVNLGQGLTQWQSLAFKKSPDVINIKRATTVLRPYNSAGESYYHRGAGITLGKRYWQLTAFASYRKVDANFVTDTSQNQEDFISSFQTSGYHRTKSETDDKGIQRQFAFGGNFSYQYKRLNIGINAIQYKFKLPLIKSPDPYNLYALTGTNFGNYSLDYSYTFKNIHLFGEAAFTSNFDKAFINGIIFSASTLVDVSILYRNISKAYQSLYTSAFTENSYPTNEKGLYGGISIRPGNSWRIDAYADFYKFPWLRYGVDAPSAGSDYLIQALYRPNKQLEIYTRYHAESKAANVNPDQLITPAVLSQPKERWRTQISYRINAAMTLRNRTEIVWFDKKGVSPEEGFLIYFDIFYKPVLKPFATSLRLQYFETGGYDSRLYAYENDVFYSYSTPVFYDKGYRYYINFSYDVNRKISFWAKWSQTIYRDKTLIGSGLDEIEGNVKSEVKLQALYKF